MDPNQQAPQQAQQASQQTQPAQDSGMTFDSSPVQQDTPVQGQDSGKDSGMTFDSAPVQTNTTVEQNGKPRFAPYEAAFSRYTTPENYEKWASTPPKSGPDSKPGEYEAWTGANTPGGAMETLKNSLRPLPYAALAGGAALGVTAIPEAASALYELAIKHLASDVLPELVTNAGESGAEVAYDTAHAKLLELAPKVWQAAKVLGGTSLGIGGLRELWKMAASGTSTGK